MKKSLRLTLSLVGMWIGLALPVQAQTPTPAAHSVIPWFTVQNKALVVQTGNKAKPLTQDVALPNGVRLEYRTQSVLLTNGTRVHMQEGDLLSLNGEYVPKNPPAESAATTEATAPSVAAEPAPVAAPAPAVPTPAPAASPAAFTFRPTAPVGGKLKGVVELGASGFNMFIVRIDGQHNWQLEKSEFGNSLVMENMATADDIRSGLKAYIGKMLDFGVNGRDIYFVVSSGAATADVTRRIVQELESLKYKVNTVTPEREGTLGLRAALPNAYADKAFVLDIGSANSKISWLERGLPQSLDTHGSKYYEKGLNDAIVATEVKVKAGQVPAKLRRTCFIIGGAPYELAKAVRQGQEPFTVLSAPSAYASPAGAKGKAGLNIYRAVADATGCQQFVFGYDANFTIGYLLSLP
ncbi:DUF6799 domain-containing protein [Hymenobacter negativus]|uniref:DUF6799 domain-containing protein n=1 Tax=Hymenobacter negativus TaxID=2795026 RepID=A0ABS3Q9U3_9BACT|nr:DUF6799 domain-containing protein [Hymenobacter negativus]MBO2008014.1 hypothetical protein [Hymenobacter negativus]